MVQNTTRLSQSSPLDHCHDCSLQRWEKPIPYRWCQLLSYSINGSDMKNVKRENERPNLYLNNLQKTKFLSYYMYQTWHQIVKKWTRLNHVLIMEFFISSSMYVNIVYDLLQQVTCSCTCKWRIKWDFVPDFV